MIFDQSRYHISDILLIPPITNIDNGYLKKSIVQLISSLATVDRKGYMCCQRGTACNLNTFPNQFKKECLVVYRNLGQITVFFLNLMDIFPTYD